MAFLNDEYSLNNIIGTGSSIKGNLKINGSVRIDGDVDGDIEVTGNLHAGKNARLNSNISAKSVIVEGLIKGDISASESVQLLSTSIVLGNIKTRKIQADENVILNGHVIALSNSEEFEEASEKWQNYQAISAYSLNRKKSTEEKTNSEEENKNSLSQNTEQNQNDEENQKAQEKEEFIPVDLGQKIPSSTHIFNSFNSNR